MTITSYSNDAVIIEATLTVTPSAPYASGNFMGLIGSGTGIASNPIALDPMPWPLGTAFIIQTVNIIDMAKQNAAIDVLFFTTLPTATTFTDSSALNLAPGDMGKLIGGAYNVTKYDSFSATSIGKATNLAAPGIIQGLEATGAKSPIYAALVCRGTPTYTTANDLRLRVAILRWTGA